MTKKHNTKNIEATVNVRKWRVKFTVLRYRLKGISVLQALIVGDRHYNTTKGYLEYKNVLGGKANIEKTVRACAALEEYFLSLSKSPKPSA